MKKNICKIVVILLFVAVSFTIARAGEEDEPVIMLKNKEITKMEFDKILTQHKLWLDSRGKAGYPANLQGGFFSNVDMRKVNLDKAVIDDVIFSECNLAEATFKGAKITNKCTEIPNFIEDFPAGGFVESTLTKCDFSGATLENVSFVRGTLKNAKFGTCISVDGWPRSEIINLDIKRKKGTKKILHKISAKLYNCYFYKIDITDAKFLRATLVNSSFSGTTMNNAMFLDTIFNNVVYNPKKNSFPDFYSIARNRSLHRLSYKNLPQRIYELRLELKKAGLKDAERQLTYAIMHNERIKTYTPLWSAITYLFFELPSGWGMYPGRPLLIMLFLIPFFAIAYLVALYRPGPVGIYRQWNPDRVLQGPGKKKPIERLDANRNLVDNYAIYFSILSAFHIGWRDLNVGTWISRMQPREYTLRATGWVRFVSGLQSLISVYLLALAVLTYFGRPFG